VEAVFVAWAAADRVEAVRQAAMRTTRKAARALIERLDRLGLLFQRSGLTRRERITGNPPTTVLLPDFRELPRAQRRAECATVKDYWLPTDRMTEVD
jgi:hypothetical protein